MKTKGIRQVVTIKTTPHAVYEALMDSKKHGAFTGGKAVISGLRRVSRPGLRLYRSSDELPRVLGGMGIAILTTSKGLMTDHRARKEHVGGEILAYVWSIEENVPCHELVANR